MTSPFRMASPNRTSRLGCNLCAKTLHLHSRTTRPPNGGSSAPSDAMENRYREQFATVEDSSQAWQDEIWTCAAAKKSGRRKQTFLPTPPPHLRYAGYESRIRSRGARKIYSMAFLDAQSEQILEVLQRTGQSRDERYSSFPDNRFSMPINTQFI